MEFSSFDTHCLEILERRPNRISKHCFRSAINHLARAEKLITIDSAMAAFRCYTAEEEAASGLMHCLKEQGYSNSSKLDHQHHVQKNAFIPFFTILRQFIEDSFKQYGIELFLLVNESEKERYISLEVTMASASGPAKFHPTPPLNFSFITDGKRFSYRQQIDAFVKSRDAKDILSCLRNEANKRNLVLYATQNGFPSSIEFTSKFMIGYQNRVMAMLRAYLMIAPYRDKQPFVQDSLDAFLAMVTSLKLDDLHDLN